MHFQFYLFFILFIYCYSCFYSYLLGFILPLYLFSFCLYLDILFCIFVIMHVIETMDKSSDKWKRLGRVKVSEWVRPVWMRVTLTKHRGHEWSHWAARTKRSCWSLSKRVATLFCLIPLLIFSIVNYTYFYLYFVSNYKISSCLYSYILIFIHYILSNLQTFQLFINLSFAIHETLFYTHQSFIPTLKNLWNNLHSVLNFLNFDYKKIIKREKNKVNCFDINEWIYMKFILNVEFFQYTEAGCLHTQ